MDLSKATSFSAIQMADTISEMRIIFEKIYVLADDISTDCFEKIDFKSQRGKFTLEYDINVLRLKWGMLFEYILPALELSRKLVSYSNEMITFLNEKGI